MVESSVSGHRPESKRLVQVGSLLAVSVGYVVLSVVAGRFVLEPLHVSVEPAHGVTLPATLVAGPAGAWGAAVGYLVADVTTGGIDVSSVFGALGQLFLGLVGHDLWKRYGSTPVGITSSRDLWAFFLAAFGGSVAATLIEAWGTLVVGSTPFFVASVLWLPATALAVVLVGLPVLLVWQRIRGAFPTSRAVARGDVPRWRLSTLAFVGSTWYFGGTILSLGLYVAALVPAARFQSLGLGGVYGVVVGPISTTVQVVFSSVLFVWLLVSYVARS